MHQYNKNSSPQKGFTLVELMLAMAFVGSLLIIITLITMQIMSLYNKGITIKGVNEVTSVVVRDVQQSIAATDYFRIQYVDPDEEDVDLYAASLKEASDNNVDYYTNAAGGRLCTGAYSYVWNTGAAVKAAKGNLLTPGSDMIDDSHIQYLEKKLPDDSIDLQPVRFLKVRDAAKGLCRLPTAAAAPADEDRYSKIVNANSEGDFSNVFGAGNQELVLYRMHVTTPLEPMIDQSQERLTAASNFYHVSMIIGTQQGDEGTTECEDDDRYCGDATGGIVVSSQACKPPSEAEFNASEYCAVNRVEFVARTGRIGN